MLMFILGLNQFNLSISMDFQYNTIKDIIPLMFTF
jgi:hypothetical protein